jgi:NitT/TauT family transport system substrate-binding protein
MRDALNFYGKPDRRTLGLILLLAALAGFTGGCGKTEPPAAAGATKPLTKVVLQTDWFAEPEHGGFYQALVKGYYRDAGLDVEIHQGGPSTRPQQMVASDQADFAIGRSDEIMLYASRGVPVVMVGAYMQRDPQAIMFHEESGIHAFKDLAGRNIMAVPGSAFITILENTFHLKVAVTPSDFGMNRFLADNNFVQQCFVTNEPFYVRRAGAHVGVLLLSDSGFSPYRVWYTRRSFVAEHPEVVKAFSAASARGWRDYMAGDRAAANASIAALNPKMEPEFLEFSVHAMQEYHLIEGEPAAGEAAGQIRRDHLEKQIRQLTDIGMLDGPVTVDQVFDPRFQDAGK